MYTSCKLKQKTKPVKEEKIFYFLSFFFTIIKFQGCSWAFTSSSKLRRHQFKHTNVRNFQCPIEGCGKMFMRSEHLKEHALTHSSERTFQCPHPSKWHVSVYLVSYLMCQLL